MLPKLRILMLLATMVAESLSAPPSAGDGPLEKLVKELGLPAEEFRKMVEKAPNLLGNVVSDFSLSLMKALLTNPENAQSNILFSPFSIHTALSMVYFGSQIGSESRQQMAKALAIDDDNKFTGILLLNYYKLLHYLKACDKGLELANRIFIRPRFPIHPTYNIFTEGFYGASASKLDLNPDMAVNQINDFVKEKTHGMIKELLAPGSLSDLTAMVLVNAIYHKDDWLYKFDIEETDSMTFYPLVGQPIQYPYGMRMTSKKLRFAEYEGIDSKVVELPYKNQDISMYIIIPNQNTPDALDRAATGFYYEEVEGKLKCCPDGVKIIMPRFETTFKTDLVKTMVELGMTDVFNTFRAALSYISKKALSVTSIFHEATVKVDEEGSEASAATAVAVCMRDFCGPQQIHVDKPFIMMIRDNKHGIPLFFGRILNPEVTDNPDCNGESP